MKSRWLPMIGLVISLAPAGCEKPPSAQPALQHDGYIACVGAAINDPYWPVLRATAEQSVEGLRGLRLVTQAPTTRSADAQIQLLRALPEASLRGICIVPSDADSEALRETLCEFETRGVKVITMLERVECADTLPFAGIDEVAAGSAMADALIETLDGKGTAALVFDSTAKQDLQDRLVGFEERMRTAPGIQIQKKIDILGDATEAKRAIHVYTERFPRLGAWAAIDNWPLRDDGADPLLLPTSCRLITTTPLPKYWEYLRSRTTAALIGTRYERITDAALRMCTAAIQQEPLKSRSYLAPPLTVTAKNLNWYQAYWFDALERPVNARDADGSIDDQSQE